MIYIIPSVKEGSEKLNISKETVIAVSRTGGVVTSAEFILGVTFASLTTLPLRDLFQLGFVVALGAILDSCFVRRIILPVSVMSLGKWSWQPLRQPEPGPAKGNQYLINPFLEIYFT